jgi:hypothetical protein
MPYKVNLPPFGAVGHAYSGSPILEKAETAETRLAAISGERIRAGESSHPYEARLRAVLLQTCRPEYPAGMVLWLETSDPGLYDDLTRRLPDLIHRLWMVHAPLGEFQRVVDAWLATHRRACELYKIENAR